MKGEKGQKKHVKSSSKQIIMEEDKLTDFERAEYYKEQFRTTKFRQWLFCTLRFGVGFAVARALYLTVLKPC